MDLRHAKKLFSFDGSFKAPFNIEVFQEVLMWALWAMEIFRPNCSAAVRHQVRLEVILALVPALCTLSVILAAVAGELKNSNYTAVLLLHAVLMPVVIGIGVWMKLNNSLHSLAHYLEDAGRSNDLLVACSWAPLLLYLVPMLFIGDASGLTDTYMTVIGYFLLYVPVLDTPYYSLVSYAAYSCLACIRILVFVLTCLHSGIHCQTGSVNLKLVVFSAIPA